MIPRRRRVALFIITDLKTSNMCAEALSYAISGRTLQCFAIFYHAKLEALVCFVGVKVARGSVCTQFSLLHFDQVVQGLWHCLCYGLGIVC